MALVLSFTVFAAACQRNPAPGPPPPVQFENLTEAAGLLRYSPTFSAVVADIDNNGSDDIFVGNHAYPPFLFLNEAGVFREASELVPLDNRLDRHGFTFVDLDNDGDRDFVYAGGGADGIGRGVANAGYRNLLVETGSLAFSQGFDDADIGYRMWRSRQFLPLPNRDGSLVDLYLTSLHKRRVDTTNLYFTNTSADGSISFAVDGNSSLNRRFESRGMDLFFDYDRDGDVDFLRIGEHRARLYRNDGGTFSHIESEVDEVRAVHAATVADFDNDGYPDLYFGALSGYTDSDNVSANAGEIHFSIVDQAGDAFDEIVFSVDEAKVAIDFREHYSDQGRSRTDPGDIFLGKGKDNPARRLAVIGGRQATGRPEVFDRDGTYLWHDPDSERWHLRWQHAAPESGGAKGILYGTGIRLLEHRDREAEASRQVRDYIVMNRTGGAWQVLDLPLLHHAEWTNDVTAADFNNDGFVDIIGVRSRDIAEENGTPFIVINHGDGEFSRQEILDNAEDDIFRADLVVHGFFNGDGLPDVFYTNGAGLLPSHRGPYQFWLNRGDPALGYLLLELEGTAANRDAIGAQVELYGPGDQLLGYRELGPAYGRSQDTHKLHFGLGSRQGPFSLHVRWPGQAEIQVVDVAGPGSLHLRQGLPVITLP